MNRKLLLYFSLLLLLASCTGKSTPEQKSVLTDDLERPVAVSPPVSRVLTLAPNLTEIVFAAGGGGKLVGVSTADDYPPEVQYLPRFQALPLNIEAILALKPELVLATDQINRLEDAERLEELGIPVYFFHFDELADISRAIRTVGTLLDTSLQADSAAQVFDMRLEAIRQHTASLPHPRVLVLIGVETLYAFGSPSYVHELIEVAGGQSVTRTFKRPNIVLNDEFVIEVQPDVILILSKQPEDTQRLLNHHPAFSTLSAVHEGRVYTVPPDLVARPGPRLADGATYIARLLHPDAMP